MVITPFGNLTLGDKEQLVMWLDAHNRRHAQYVKRGLMPANAQSHLGPGGTFLGPISGDWMARHTIRHRTLAQIANDPMPSANVSALGLPGPWKTELELQDWHELHNRLHSVIDRIQNLAQSQPAPPGAPPGFPGIIRPPPPGGFPIP